MPDLRVKDVSFRYPDTAADVLTSLSWDLRGGEIWWLRGRNGAGKTTLLELIAGLRAPDAGAITIDSEPIERGRVVYVPSAPAVFEELDVWEHGALVEELWQLSAEEGLRYRERLRHLVLEFELPTDGRRVAELSAGMREKLGLALLLALDAPVLLLDEPFTASDAASLTKGQSMLIDLAADRIVVVTSHLSAVVEPLHAKVFDIDTVVAR